MAQFPNIERPTRGGVLKGISGGGPSAVYGCHCGPICFDVGMVGFLLCVVVPGRGLGGGRGGVVGISDALSRYHDALIGTFSGTVNLSQPNWQM